MTDLTQYARVVFIEVRRWAARARKVRLNTQPPDLINDGTEAAFLSALLRLQFTTGIYRTEEGVPSFDPLNDELDPELRPPSFVTTDRVEDDEEDEDDDGAAWSIRTVFVLTRKMAAQARRCRLEKPDPVDEGVECGSIQVLQLMQQQADAFGIDRQLVGMADFDPLVDELEPVL